MHPDIRQEICRGSRTDEERINGLGKLMFGDLFDDPSPARTEPDAKPSCGPCATCPPGPAQPNQGESNPECSLSTPILSAAGRNFQFMLPDYSNLRLLLRPFWMDGCG